MPLKSSVLVVAVVLSIPLTVGARAQSPEQQLVKAQLAPPKLDSTPIANLDLTGTPLKDIVAEIAKAGGITVQVHSAANLDGSASAKLVNSMVADALATVLGPKSLAFKATGRKSVFIYPDTPANREKYTDSVRTFTITKADVNKLAQLLNQSVKIGPDDLRPVMVSLREPPTISVRATADMMTRIATLIADNDK